ncbi:MAG: transketolase C-terminal domain-containing protein, partial [Azonexus sp.]
GKAEDIKRGGYVLIDDEAPLQAVIIATGSEVALAVEAQAKLKAEGISVRVVSMPCTNLFDRQPAEWKKKVLPPGVCRIAIEAGHTDFWRKYVGLDGEVLGIDQFGESAPAPALFQHFGLTVEHLMQAVSRTIASYNVKDGDF